MLTECILQDPRMDFQCESRADHCTALALHLELPLEVRTCPRWPLVGGDTDDRNPAGANPARIRHCGRHSPRSPSVGRRLDLLHCLQELASDPHEDEDLRGVALARIGA